MRTSIKANCLNTDKCSGYSFKKQFYLSICLLATGLFLGMTGHTQIPSQCGSPGCTSNDVRVTKARISDQSGNYFVCTGNQDVSGAWLHLFVTTNTKRTGVFVSLTINVVSGGDTTRTNLPYCFAGRQLNGVDNDLGVALPNGIFKCGSEVFLTNIFTAWGTGTSDFCGNSTGIMCPSTPSKCRFITGEVIKVQTNPCDVPSNVSITPSSDSKCAGESASFTVNFGNNQSATIQWEVSTDNGSTWTAISNASSTTLTLANVQASTNPYQYHAIVTNHTSDQLGTHDCPTTSAPVTLTVYPTSVGGTVSPVQTICSGSQPDNDLTLSGKTGTVVKWQKSTDNFVSNITDITGTATLTTLSKTTIGALSSDTWFRAVVQSGTCPAANSSAIKITVNPATVAGSLGTAQTICSGSQPNSLTLTGNTGNVVKWQKSTSSDFTTGVTDLAITSTTLASADIGTLAGDTWFRAVVKSGVCPAVNSNSVKITVDQPTNAGTLATAHHVCSGSTSGQLSLSGNTGAIVKWESSVTSNSTGFSAIPNTAGLSSFTSGALTQTTWFRVVVKSGVCTEANSNVIEITVDPTSTGGTVSPDQTLCSGSQLSSNLILTSSTGNVVKWQKSTNNFASNVTDIDNTTTTLTATAIGPLTQDTWFRAIVQSGVCPQAVSSVVKITVDETPSTATVGGTQNLCGTLTSSGLGGNTPTVGSGTWSKQSGPGTVSFNPGASTPNATATVSTAGTYVFRWTISNGTCTASAKDITVNYFNKPGQPTADVVQPTCSVTTGTITVTSESSGLTFSINSTNPSDFTNTNGIFSGLSAGDYTVRAKNADGCISDGITKTINKAPDATPAANVVFLTNPSCSSSTGTLKVVMAQGNAEYDNTVYEFSNDGTKFVSNPVFAFTAGQGYNITVRKISDHSCTATTSCSGEVQEITNTQITTSTQRVFNGTAETSKIMESKTRVVAYPNPYNDKVKFLVTSLESGKGSLEVYNMLGQKIKTVYQGQISAGSQSFEMSVPVPQRSSLIYVLKIGDKQVSGKLLQMNQQRD